MTVSRYVRQIIEARAEKAGLRPADYIWQVVLMDRIREWTADEVKRMAGERRAARKLVTNIHMKTELDSDLRELAETPADADTIAALPADDERADVAA